MGGRYKDNGILGTDEGAIRLLLRRVLHIVFQLIKVGEKLFRYLIETYFLDEYIHGYVSGTEELAPWNDGYESDDNKFPLVLLCILMGS